MSREEALSTVLITAQRFISCSDVQKYVDYLRELGVSDDDIISCSSDYVIANSDLLEEDEDD